jgi:hypothetical protein
LASVEADAERSGLVFLASSTAVTVEQVPYSYEMFRPLLVFADVVPGRRRPRLDPAVLQLCRIFSIAAEASDDLVLEHFYQMVLGDLVDQQPRLLYRLDAEFGGDADGSEAASKLGSDDTTVRRQRKRIKHVTRYDLGDGDGRFLLPVATFLRWYASLSPSSYDGKFWGSFPKRTRRGRRGR